MSNGNEGPRKPIPNPLSKEQRARDATQATRDYALDAKATLDKTARLRELRLARDAAAAAEPQPPAKKKAGAKKAGAKKVEAKKIQARKPAAT
jgi:succinyl-CoA synthetase beta subunit